MNRHQQRLRSEIRELSAYSVPDSDGLIKLDAMENPYPWPQDMKQAWLQELLDVAINRYPDPDASGLKRCIRKNFHIPEELDLLLGNGSDELIQIVQTCMAGRDRVVVAPSPSFVMYEMCAAFVGARFVGVPLSDDFELDEASMLQVIERHDPAIVFLAYPNNPTGNLFNRQSLEKIINRCRGLVVIDEAYHAFARDSFVGDIEKYDNLVVLRTLSKLGLAGLRLGYLIGSPAWLHEFDKARMPYNINILTQATVEFAVDRLAVFETQAAQIVEERERLFDWLAETPGIVPYRSQANFILFRCDNVPASRLFDHLVNQGILVKRFGERDSRLSRCLRVTIGTAEENDKFRAGLDAVSA